MLGHKYTHAHVHIDISVCIFIYTCIVFFTLCLMISYMEYTSTVCIHSTNGPTFAKGTSNGRRWRTSAGSHSGAADLAAAPEVVEDGNREKVP